MKKLLLLLLFSSLLMYGCSEKQEKKQETKPVSKDVKEEKNTEITSETIITEDETKPEDKTILDKDVEIIMPMTDFSEDSTIELYVSELNESSEKEYYVYDESHYGTIIKESERQEMLRKIATEDVGADFIANLNENYPNVYKKMLYNDDTQEISIFVDNELYQESDFGVGVVGIIIGSIYAETIQAYNLVPVEERNTMILIIDEATGETIYSSNEE